MVLRMTVRIVPFGEISDAQRLQTAGLLVRGSAHSPSGWVDAKSAQAEVDRFSAEPDRDAFAAVSGSSVVGWIGRIRHSTYSWELHPLVVEPSRQGSGVGTLLVAALEAAARDAGVCTVWLGADDDFGGTNLVGTDLYPNVLDKLSRLSPAAGHPFTFYSNQGFSVVGVLPDVDGFGSHDILMAKRIQ
jgi:aminoglycoside 6'-N-acetyltransferase I